MKLPGAIPLAFVFASTFAVSQQPVQRAEPSRFSIDRSTTLDHCPVGLDVEQGSRMHRELVGAPARGKPPERDEAPTGFGQTIQISLKNLGSKKIVGAQFTAHGLSRHDRFVPLIPATNADLTKSIALILAVRGNERVSRELAFERFAVVTAIDLDALRYADGSSWRPSARGACSAKPNFLVRTGG